MAKKKAKASVPSGTKREFIRRQRLGWIDSVTEEMVGCLSPSCSCCEVPGKFSSPHGALRFSPLSLHGVRTLAHEARNDPSGSERRLAHLSRKSCLLKEWTAFVNVLGDYACV